MSALAIRQDLSAQAVLDAACRAWNALAAETGRLASLTAYPYLIRSELT